MKKLESWSNVKEGSALYYYDGWGDIQRCRVLYKFPEEIGLEIETGGHVGGNFYIDPSKDNPKEWIII